MTWVRDIIVAIVFSIVSVLISAAMLWYNPKIDPYFGAFIGTFMAYYIHKWARTESDITDIYQKYVQMYSQKEN